MRLGVRVCVAAGATAACLVTPAAVSANHLIRPVGSDGTFLSQAMDSGDDGIDVSFGEFVLGPPGERAAGYNDPGVGRVGNFFPTDGTEFAVMTTGDVDSADAPNDSPSTGTDWGRAARNVFDASVLRVHINVHAPVNCLGVDVAFYSEEFPEFVNSQYNDALLAELDFNDWTFDPATANVTAPHNFAFDTNQRQLTINTALPTQNDTGLEYDASTVLLRALTPVTPGEHDLYFTIYDASDGIYDSAAFIDNLRGLTLPPSLCRPGAKPADSDEDGLPDDWEASGIDVNGDGAADVDLPAMGASPTHKDIFVELDSMRPHQLEPATLAPVIRAFANAPVPNPDGINGINLHVDAGPASVMNPVTGATWGTRSRASTLPHEDVLGSFVSGPGGREYDWSEFDRIKAAHFDANRVPAFHYALSVHGIGTATPGERIGGIARNAPSSDFIIGRGDYVDGMDINYRGTLGQSMTFMHELGHNLGLRHGGDEDLNYKPNYLSIMNYMFSWGLNDGSAVPVHDYSRFGPTSAGGTVGALDENALDEAVGIPATGGALRYLTSRFCFFSPPGAGPPTPELPFRLATPTDWNCDSAIGGTVSNSINADPTREVLRPFDDWTNLEFSGGAVGGLGLGPLLPDSTPVVERPVVEEDKVGKVMATDAKAPRVFAKASSHRRLRVTARDERAIAALVVEVDGRRQTVDAKGPQQLVLRFKARLRRGRHRIVATAFDRTGNQAETEKLMVR